MGEREFTLTIFRKKSKNHLRKKNTEQNAGDNNNDSLGVEEPTLLLGKKNKEPW